MRGVSADAPPPPATPHGVLILDKPSGPTSFDMVARVRRLLGTRQVGHAGTLDPLASGVLVVMVGQATKLSDYLTAEDKTYVAQIAFGRSTDTLDQTGTTTRVHAIEAGWLTLERLMQAVERERCRTSQVPPHFSAIKQDGRRSYALARAGRLVDLPPRPVKVHALEVLSVSDTILELSLKVSKGYYVRSFARDLCDSLGVAGCLSQLRRTASGCFDLDHSCALSDATQHLLSVADAARKVLPVSHLTENGALRAMHGKKLTTTDFVTPPRSAVAAWFDPADRLIAIGGVTPAATNGTGTDEPQPVPVPADPASAVYRVLRGFAPAAG